MLLGITNIIQSLTTPHWLQWQIGRQHSGYDKMLLATSTKYIPFDLYLLRFPVGACIPPHVDQVEAGEHYRLNIILKKSKLGGEFICDQPIWSTNRIKLFRSDRSIHEVTKVISGTRYVMSIGWLMKSKNYTL